MAPRPLRTVPHVGGRRHAASHCTRGTRTPPRRAARGADRRARARLGRRSTEVYRDFEVVAVLDWEMAGVGDPLLDLGWWVFADDALTKGAGLQRLPGFPSVTETAARWSAATGRSTDALGYYILHAAFRFTVIMLRMGKLLHQHGVVPAGFAYDNLISSALRARLDAPLPSF